MPSSEWIATVSRTPQVNELSGGLVDVKWVEGGLVDVRWNRVGWVHIEVSLAGGRWPVKRIGSTADGRENERPDGLRWTEVAKVLKGHSPE